MSSKPTLEDCRKKVDEIDLAIVQLLNQRAQFSKAISAIKKESGLLIHQPQREQHILENILRHSNHEIPDDALVRIFKQIMAESRLIQSGNSADSPDQV